MTKCTQCNQDVGETPYNPMPEWKIEAPLCSKCYSNKLEEFFMREGFKIGRLKQALHQEFLKAL